MDDNLEALALQVEVPESIRKVALLRDRVLYVAQDYMQDSRVLDFEMKLLRIGLLANKTPCDATSIEAMQRNAHQIVESRSLGRGGTPMEQQNALALLRRSVEMSASDVHIAIGSRYAKIKMRIDGYLDTYAEITSEEARSLAGALYVMCGHLTKNGNQFHFNGPLAARLTRDAGLPEKLYAVRFASMPSESGGLIVLRNLYDQVSSRMEGEEKKQLYLEDLGFNEQQVHDLKAMADVANGMVILVGPTGAGKSTTLKSIMEWMEQTYPHFNKLTVEDPPEYPISGAIQFPVSVQEDDQESGTGRGEQYASIIATTLRLDPDVLMVGEIRDGHSALAALRAAQTGHRLWTTLHANDGWEALNRMSDLLREAGIMDPMVLLGNTQNLAGTMAQRLIPKLCPRCRMALKGNAHRIPEHVMSELMEAIPDMDADQIYLRGDGCGLCVPMANGDHEKEKADKRHGILGRTVVAEIIRPDQALLDIVRKEGVPAARHYWLKHRNGHTLMDHALTKIQAGVLAPDVVREFAGPLISSRQTLAVMEREDSV